MDFIVTEPKLALNAVRMMADHVLEFQERFSQLATERVERRLARSILRLASQAGRKIEDGVLIDLPLSRQDLAEMNGTTLYTVSRIMSQWEEQGLVRLGRERVVIRFPHGLVRIAEDLA
jgi:CRP-like cAMP-binding protein